MLDVYCMNGLPTEADKLFEEAQSMGLLPDSSTYKLLYKAYTKANMKDFAQKLLKHMDSNGVTPNKRFFLDALGALRSSDACSDAAIKAAKVNTAKTLVEWYIESSGRLLVNLDLM